MRVDLNVDIGEGFGLDADLLEFASSANVCCGEHAGSLEHAGEIVALCRSKGVRVGAHPGYPDRDSMGRRDPEPHEQPAFAASILVQVRHFAHAYACEYVKPHGAWYNAICRGEPLAVGLARTVCAAFPMRLMILPAAAGHVGGQEIIREGFCDRRYTADGLLAPRSEPGALLEDLDAIAAQAVSLAKTVDSICLHGDTPNALAMAEAVVRALTDAGFEVGA